MANIPKPRPLNPNTSAPSPIRSWSVPKDILTIAIVFVGITIGSAFVYYLGSQYNWGIKPTFSTTETYVVDLWDCLYFSLVTIATLGYGDFRPESFSRIVAAFEVVAGIILMGLMVSRLVSRQQERLTKRLLKGFINQEIQSFRDQLDPLLETCATIRSRKDLDDSDAEWARFSDWLLQAAYLARSIARYWRSEASLPDLAEIAQSRAMGRLLSELATVLEFVTDMTATKTTETIGEENRKHIRNISESCLTVAEVFEEHINENGIKHSSQRIYERVTQLRQQFTLHR